MNPLVVVLGFIGTLGDPLCTFQNLTDLSRCQISFQEWATASCPNSLPVSPPGISIHTSQAFPPFGATGPGTRAHLPRPWTRLHDHFVGELVAGLITGERRFNGSDLRGFIKPDQPFVSIVLAALCPIIGLVAILLMCCRCCRPVRKRPPTACSRFCRKLYLLWSVVLIGVTAFFVHTSGRKTRRLNRAEMAAQCVAPRTMSAFVSNNIMGVSNDPSESFDGLVRLGNTLQTAHKHSTYMLEDYLEAFDAGGLASFALTAPFAPLLWSGPLLERQLAVVFDISGEPRSAPLRHALVGYRALRELGDFNARDSGPLAQMYLQIDSAQSTLYFDLDPVRDAARSINSMLTVILEHYDSWLGEFSDWWNSEATQGSTYWKMVMKPHNIAPVAYIVPAVLLGLVAVALWLNIYSDQRRDAFGQGVAYFMGTLFGLLVLHAMLLFTLCALILTVMKFLKSGCEYGARNLGGDLVEFRHLGTTSVDDIGLGDLNASRIADICLRRGGDGDILSFSEVDDELRNLANQTMRYDVNIPFLIRPTFDSKIRNLSEHANVLSWVLPNVDYSQNQFLLRTNSVFLESGVQLDTEIFDCVDPEVEFICKAIIDLRNGIGLRPSGTQLKLHGLSDISAELSEIFQPLTAQDCSFGRVCIFGDTTCRDPDFVVDTNVLALPLEELLRDVPTNWHSIVASMARTDQAAQFLNCLLPLSDIQKTAAILGIFWSLLKVTLLKPALRPENFHLNDQNVDSTGFPGYFDSCPPGASCTPYYRFHGNFLSRPLYENYRATLRDSLTTAVNFYGLEDLHHHLLDLAVTTNPIGNFISIATVPREEYNCQVVGRAADHVEQLVCQWWGPSWARLGANLLLVGCLFLTIALTLFWKIWRNVNICTSRRSRVEDEEFTD